MVGALDGGSTTRPETARGQPHVAFGAPPRRPVARHRRTGARAIDRIVHRVLARLPFVSIAGRRRREIALTFDDGPGPYTLRVVRDLDRLRVPATFFQVGVMVHGFPLAERRLAADPRFVIGDHTETHAMLTRLTRGAQAAEIDNQAIVLRAAGVPTPALFRPPYGMMNRATLAALRARRMLAILWTVDSQDYRRPGVKAIVYRVVSGARPGAIVLMHDAGGDRSQTVAALPRIVHLLRMRGYRLVTVPRLLRDDPPPRRQPRPAGVAAGI